MPTRPATPACCSSVSHWTIARDASGDSGPALAVAPSAKNGDVHSGAATNRVDDGVGSGPLTGIFASVAVVAGPVGVVPPPWAVRRSVARCARVAT